MNELYFTKRGVTSIAASKMVLHYQRNERKENERK